MFAVISSPDPCAHIRNQIPATTLFLRNPKQGFKTNLHLWYVKRRGGLLEDVLGLEDVLEDTFPSPWPWPRSLKSFALASKPQVLENCPVLGSRTALFFESLKFCLITPKTSRKVCKYLFCFLQLKHRLSQAGLPLIEISPMTKMWQKPIVFSVLVSFYHFSHIPVANNNIEDKGPGTPSNQFLPANLNVNLEEMDSFRPKSCYLKITSSLFMNVMH